ncbi:MAG: tetratricopeptide repeat protein [Bacteroidetes bacterium]|nr:tetratricopeptide repeat protein [Bacteroidota bacterium]
MKRVIVLMQQLCKVGIATAFCLTFTIVVAQDAELKTAHQQINKDKKKLAVETLKKAVSTYPDAANLYYYLGKAQLLNGDRAGAKASFDKGVAIDHKVALNFVGQGYILLLEKNVAGAKEKFDEAIHLGKKDVTTLNAIAEAYLSDKAYQKDAMALLQRSKSLKPENAETQILLGDAFLLENNGGSCASAYENACYMDPSNPIPWYKLGELFMRSKNVPVVEEKLLKTISIEPDYALAHRELGEMYYLKKDGANAVKHYKKYLDLTDSPAKDDRFKLAFFYFMAKEYDNANKEFESLRKKPDVSSTTLKFAAQSQLKSGNLAESEKIFEEYLKHPDTKVDADDYANLGELRQQQGKDSLAAVAYEKSISLDRSQNEILQLLIKHYFEQKNYNNAERVCRISIKERKTPSTNDYFNLGRSLIAQKKYNQADSAFAKVIELQPKITLGYLWAARAKTAQDGDLREDPNAKMEWLAKPYYEELIKVGEPNKDKYKSDLITAYQYMAGYHLFKQENQQGKEFLNKILELDPENADAKQALKEINTPPQSQKPRRK